MSLLEKHIGPTTSYQRLARDLVTGGVSEFDAFLATYADQVEHWILKPAQGLIDPAAPRHSAMAALTLCLQFFEPHGFFMDHNLTSSNQRIKRAWTDCAARLGRTLDVDWPKHGKAFDLRNGLFHSAGPYHPFEVVPDRRRKATFKKAGTKWLVVPHLLVQDLVEYFGRWRTHVAATAAPQTLFVDGFKLRFGTQVQAARMEFATSTAQGSVSPITGSGEQP